MSTSKSLNDSRLRTWLKQNTLTDIKGICYGVKHIQDMHNLIRCNGPYASSLLLIRGFS